MKLLHVHDFIAPGNSRYGVDLDRQLIERGHEVHILAGVGELGPVREIPCHHYPYGFGMSAIRMYRYSIRQNREMFENLQKLLHFDLVLFNQPLCATGVLSSDASRDVRRAYSFLSPWAAEWRAANPDAGLLRRSLHMGARNRLEEKALRACHSILVVSRFMQKQLRELHPSVPEDRQHLVPGAVDLQRFKPNGTVVRQGGPILLTVRRLVPRMGIENLIEAMPAVLREFPTARLIVGGDGPCREDLERRAKGLPVEFAGYVPDDDLPGLYRKADVFVLPTRELEGFGLVAIEAMACGTPVLGTPVGAIPEVLDPEMLLPGTDAASIAAGIVKFLRSPRPEGLREKVLPYDWTEVGAAAERALLAALKP